MGYHIYQFRSESDTKVFVAKFGSKCKLKYYMELMGRVTRRQEKRKKFIVPYAVVFSVVSGAGITTARVDATTDGLAFRYDDPAANELVAAALTSNILLAAFTLRLGCGTEGKTKLCAGGPDLPFDPPGLASAYQRIERYDERIRLWRLRPADADERAAARHLASMLMRLRMQALLSRRRDAPSGAPDLQVPPDNSAVEPSG
jgi:hypothetical protein